MAVDEVFAQQIREAFLDLGLETADEKYMFGGVCFMVNGHMCCGIAKDALMCRIGAERQQVVADLPGCRPMDFTGKPMKGYVFVDKEVLQKKSQLKFWLQHCLVFNSTLKKR